MADGPTWGLSLWGDETSVLPHLKTWKLELESVAWKWDLAHKKENEVALLWTEMRMVRWMCGMKLQDRVPSKGLRERLGLDDKISVLQQNRLQWYGHVLRKEENDWVKKCVENEVEGARPRGRPKKTWREILEEVRQAHKLNMEDMMDETDEGRMMATIGASGWMSVVIPAHPGCPGQNPESRKTVVCMCVCCCMCACGIAESTLMSSVSSAHCTVMWATDDHASCFTYHLLISHTLSPLLSCSIYSWLVINLSDIMLSTRTLS